MIASPAQLFRRLRAAPSGVLAALKAAADHQYAASFHLIVRDPTRTNGFALFGGHRLRHHLSRIYFGGGTKHGLKLGWHRGDIEAAAERLVRQYGLALFTGDSIPGALADRALRLPFMVELEKAMPPTLEGPGAGWTRSALTDIARVKRAGFRCTVDSAEAFIGEFCRDFTSPSMKQRHGAEFIPPSTRVIRNIATSEGAELLRVWLDGIWVGGILNSLESDGYRLRYLGWRHGDPGLLKQHIVPALYWFSLRRAFELGHVRCLMGGTWPSLDDGLIFFKGKWGARLDATSQRYPDLHVLLNPAHETCRRFLTRHSLVTRGAGGDLVVLSTRARSEMRVPPSILASVSRWYRWRWPEDVSLQVDHPDVPACLRPWLVQET